MAVVVVLHRVGVAGRVAGAVVVVVVVVMAVVRGELVMDVVRTVVVISPDYLLLVLRRTE